MSKSTKDSLAAPRAGTLRRKAERRASDEKTRPAETAPEQDVEAVLHELEVHQIELEMQNEELRCAQAEAEEAAAKYHELFDFAPGGHFLLGEGGRILEVNLAGAALVDRNRDAIVNRPFAQFIVRSERVPFAEFAKRVLESGIKQGGEFALIKGSATIFAHVEAVAVGDTSQPRLWRIAIIDISDRKKIEESLRLSEQRQRAILDTIPDPAWLKDRDGRFLAVNPAWCRLHGLDAQEAVGKTVFDVFARDIAERLTRQDAAVTASGAPLRVEETLHDHDGRLVWLETVKTAVSNLDGRIVGTASIARDITARRQSQEALRQANQHLRMYQRIIERSPDFFIVLDREYVYRMVNAAVLRKRRKKSEEVIGHTMEEVIGKEDFQRVRPYLEQAFTGQVVRFSDWFVYPNLGPRFVTVAYYPLTDETGQTEFVVGDVHDATRRKRTEDALQQSEARYRSLFDDSPIALWEHDCSELKRYIDELRRSGVTDFKAYFLEHRQAVVDCVNRIRPLDVNHAAVTLHRAHSKEELLAGFPRLFREETYEAFLSALLAIADGKTLFRFDCAACTLRGETIYESIRCAAAPGCEQTLAKVFLSAIDITERKQAEDSVKKWVDAQTAELAAANRRLQHEVQERRQAEERLHKRQAELAHLSRVKTMGEMANGLAHELNQPLAAILMRAEVAAKKLRTRKEMPQEDLLAVLDFIADETHRGGEIIRRIRQFVRKTEPEATAVDPAEVVGEVLPLVEKDLQDAGIALAVSVCPKLPRILADKIQVQQVLLNLVRNAAEAMTGTSQDARVLGVSAEARDKVVAISVSDTGCGVSEERMAALFGTFSSTKAGGMGVGLMISRSIVEAHGGAIWATRNRERGMTFTFTLPIAAEEQ